MIYIKNDRSVFPNNVKVSNQYENETRTIQFDLSDVQFTGNTYLICKYQNNQDFYAPLLLDSNFSIPVETFLSAQAGTYSCVIAISTATIDENYDFSTDNPLFVSNIFTLTVDANFLTGTSTSWQLTPAAQNYFDQLIALVEKVQSDLDSGAFVGNGIQSITKISTSGLVDTYQITFTNGSTFDYQVINGHDGQTPTITIQDGYWYINGVNTGQQAQGDKGDPGDNATINVGAVTTLEPGQEATVTNTGSETNAVLAFGIPKGEKGDKGDKGEPGDNATINVGAVTTLEPGQEATVQNTGTETNAVLSFGIPKGKTGATGPQGPQGEPGVNENVLHADISKSENPSIDDAYEAPLQDLKMYGKSTQVSTSGKNLFDRSTAQENKVLAWGTGNYADENNSLASDFIPVRVGETYHVNYKCQLCLFDSDKTKINFVNGNGNVVNADFVTTFTIYDEQAKFIKLGFRTGQNSYLNMNDVDDIMLNVGSTATTYEPYTGGAPSPNPDYPQEITKIEEVDCLVTGANLFDISTSEDGSINNGQETATQGYKRTDYIPVTPGGTISRTPQDITGTAGNFFYDIDKNFLTNISSSSSSTIAVPENAYYYRFVFKNTLTELMVNVGETLLPYEPYQSQHVQFTPPAPLYSLLDGSVADYVDVARGKYVYQLANTVFDGSEDEGWDEYNSEDLGYEGVLIQRLDMKVANRQGGFCDKLNVATHPGGGVVNLYSVWLGVYNNYIYIPYANTFAGTTNAAEFKTWLATNNLRFVYPLATPTEQDIPAETLEALQALKTFNGVTNIFCNAPVSAQYEQSVQIVMNKILEQLNKLQTQTLNLQEEMINNV